ncbi:siroheme synthase CysG [Moraxella sp. FZLJ2107]|uniref:siroheme synthase CysG n=1 Tax=unclassified Moraxella TaxID=2685852 RepID=UPI0020C8FF3B|nr:MULTISPECIES: siroheme synthase CysG [unclassified Moraxella]UTO05793.1 siroheme synthase CysG [Moraxella sp. FZLJ2107]UTO22529.1 siroheme synthase CysG [Moraxella sp. FZLJ2109]
MKTLPLFFDLANKTVLIVGGGDVAHRKAMLMAKAGAKLVVIAKNFDDEFVKFLNNHQAIIHQKSYDATDLDAHQPSIVIAATDDHAVNVLVHGDCQARRIAINVVDTPALCDFIFPAIVDRDPVVIGVSSNGKAPVLARLIRAKIESVLPSGLGKLAAKAGEFRATVKEKLPTITERRYFWESVFGRAMVDQSVGELDTELSDFIENNDKQGEVYIVGAGAGDPDLLTFKALRLMQQADVVLYDALVSPEILDLCRRDSQKIFVGKKRQDHAKTQDEINALLVKYAKAGHRVLRLKGGDPFVFGRGGEEMLACRQAGVPYQVVSGITAALAASSSTGIPLTHRGVATSVRFLTGCYKTNEAFDGLKSAYQADETLVFYMGLHALPKIVENLSAQGLPSDLPVAIVSNASLPNQAVLTGTLANIVAKQEESGVSAPAIIIVGKVVDLYQG